MTDNKAKNFAVVQLSNVSYNPESVLWQLLGVEPHEFFCVNEYTKNVMGAVLPLSRGYVAAQYSQLSEDGNAITVPSIPKSAYDYESLKKAVTLGRENILLNVEFTTLKDGYFNIDYSLIDTLVEDADLEQVAKDLISLNDGIDHVYALGGSYDRFAIARRRVTEDGKVRFFVNEERPYIDYDGDAAVMIDGVKFTSIVFATLLRLGVRFTIGVAVKPLVEWNVEYHTALIKNDVLAMTKMAYRSALVEVAKVEKSRKAENARVEVAYDPTLIV